MLSNRTCFVLLWLTLCQSGFHAFVQITPVRSPEDRHGNALVQNKHFPPESPPTFDDDWLIRNFNDPIAEELMRPAATTSTDEQSIPSIPVQQHEYEANSMPISMEQEIQALRYKQDILLQKIGPREPVSVSPRIEELQRRAEERVSQYAADIEGIQGGKSTIFPSAGALAVTGALCFSTVSFAARWALMQTNPDLLLMLENDISMALQREWMLVNGFLQTTIASLPEDSVPLDQVRELASSNLAMLSQAKDLKLEAQNADMVQFLASSSVWKDHVSEQNIQSFDRLVEQGSSMAHLGRDSIDDVAVMAGTVRESMSRSALAASETTLDYAKQTSSQIQTLVEKIVDLAGEARSSISLTLSSLPENSLRIGHQTAGWCQDVLDESVKRFTLAAHDLERPLLRTLSSTSASVKETADSLLGTLDSLEMNEIITIPDVDSSSLTS